MTVLTLIQASVKWSLLGVVVIGLIAFATFTSAKADANPASQEISDGQAIGPTKVIDTSLGITIEDIEGQNFKGK